MTTKLTPVSISINLGSTEVSQARRLAYQTAAQKAGVTLPKWVKDTLDKASGYQHE